MGRFVNPDNSAFQVALNAEIYLDKTGLIAYANRVLDTPDAYICNSRPRRFGKSYAANMLAAYYSRGTDSEKMFADLDIGKTPLFRTHLNRYEVIHIDVQWFRSYADGNIVSVITESVMEELRDIYPDILPSEVASMPDALSRVREKTGRKFVIIIDEWDVLIRDASADTKIQNEYISFLRGLFKGVEPTKYIALAYLTGILPIKKYGTHSALNMFDEFSMLNPGPLAPYVGFTEDEVAALCQKYQMDLDEIKNWYDGYSFSGAPSVYSPRSVVNSMLLEKIGNYWNQTETFEALQVYIDMNFDSLKDDILSMIAGESVPVNTGSFINDMTTFRTEDDVLTLLIHLGYLSYDSVNKCVFIPNEEVRTEYINAVSVSDWGEISKALKNSSDTLTAIWQNRPVQVAEGIKQAHFETSHLQYNDENALSYTISLALFAARNFYTIYRELPTGKGFADLVFLPRKRFPEKPALLVELKWDKSATGAITQIKEKEYVQSLEEYHGNLLLVGINYDVKTKEHECVIEPYVI